MKPKFYKNTDNNHCLQCCVRMVHDSVLPKQNWVDEEKIDCITEYEPQLYTWTISGAMFLAQKLNGVKIINGGFDYRKFSLKKKRYLEEVWKLDRLRIQESKASSGFEKESKQAQRFLENGGVCEQISFNEETIQKLIQSSFLIAQVDHGKLYSDSFSGACHYVLLYSLEDDKVETHDPGEPSRPSCRINLNTFLLAFCKELISIPKPDWWSSELKIGRNDSCPCGSGKKNKKCHDFS